LIDHGVDGEVRGAQRLRLRAERRPHLPHVERDGVLAEVYVSPDDDEPFVLSWPPTVDERRPRPT